MKKLLAVILTILALQIVAGCEKEQETLERIIEHINILEEELPNEDKEYLANNLLDIKTGVLSTSPSGELPTSPTGVAFWYNREGKLDESYTFTSNEYLYISRELVMKHTDGKLIGQYYVDENFNVYYFGGRDNNN
jgi:hypothetical protein